MKLYEKFSNILHFRLKDSFVFKDLNFEVLDKNEWCYYDNIPVLTYRVHNPKNIAWRYINLMDLFKYKVQETAILTSNPTLIRESQGIPRKFICFIDQNGERPNQVIPKQIKDKIKIGLSKLSDNFLKFPKTKSNLFWRYVPENSTISFKFKRYLIETDVDTITIFLFCSKINIKTPNGEINDIDFYGERDEYDIPNLIEFINYEWPEIVDSYCWKTFEESGLLSSDLFYDRDIDYVRFQIMREP